MATCFFSCQRPCLPSLLRGNFSESSHIFSLNSFYFLKSSSFGPIRSCLVTSSSHNGTEVNFLKASEKCTAARRQKKWEVRAASENGADAGAAQKPQEEDKEDLTAKLAAAEAEAEALRRELGLRRAEKLGDLSKLKPAPPPKRIDGTGFRETILGSKGGTGKPEQQMGKWGLSEADLFVAKDGPSEGLGLQEPAMEEGGEDVVKRRLFIGLGITAVTLALAFVKLPTQILQPTKPLFFYLVPLIQLKETLELLSKDEGNEEISIISQQIKATIGSSDALRKNLLSAASLFEIPNQDSATNLAFEILEYLDQADYTKYFENRGKPSATQQAEYLRFSFESVKAALLKLKTFLSLAPTEDLEAAYVQISARFNSGFISVGE